MPGMRALITYFVPKVMGDSTRGQSPGPSAMGGNGTANSGVSFDRKVRLSRTYREPIEGEKDSIPLVEIKDYNSPRLGIEDKESDWPLDSKVPRRLSHDGQSIRSLDRTVTMEA